MDDEASRLQWNPDQENLAAYTTQTQGLRQWSDGSLGSSGQVLTSGGSGSQWIWQTLAAMTGNSKITVKTSGSGTHTTQSWCRTVVAVMVGGGGGGGTNRYSYDDDDGTSQGYGGSGGSGGVKFHTQNTTGATNISYSVGNGGAAHASGGSCDDSPTNGGSGGTTSFGSSSAGGGGGGQGANAGSTGAGGSGGSGDLPGAAGGSATATAAPFWGKYGTGGTGTSRQWSHDDGGCFGNAGTGGAIIIMEIG